MKVIEWIRSWLLLIFIMLEMKSDFRNYYLIRQLCKQSFLGSVSFSRIGRLNQQKLYAMKIRKCVVYLLHFIAFKKLTTTNMQLMHSLHHQQFLGYTFYFQCEYKI